MKYLFLSVILFAFVSCQEEKAEIDRSKTDWVTYKLEGNVKSVSEKSYQMLESGVADTTNIAHEIRSAHNLDIEFNDEGMVISEKKWKRNGKPFEEIKYEGKDKVVQRTQYIDGKASIITKYAYNSYNNNTTVTRRKPDNKQIDKIVKSYNADKLDEQKTFNNDNKGIDRVTYAYDKNGNLIGENLYLGTEAVQYKNVYEYDDNGKKTSDIRYNKDSEIVYKTLFEYDGDKISVRETTNGDGEVEYIEKFTYDDKGNVTVKSTYEKYDDSETTDKFRYDEKGNKISWVIDKNGVEIMKAEYTYDDKSNLTLIQTYYGDKLSETEERSYTYEYDDKGNWIKKKVSINNKPEFIVERKITYFK